MGYFLHILILTGIYSILSISLNLLVGYIGSISIAHAAFYGAGAYIVALLAIKLQIPFLLNLFIAVIGVALFGTLIGFPAIRIKDDNFIITTLAFQIVVFSILNNFVSLTNGPIGLSNIPKPSIFGIKVSTHFDFAILVLIFNIFVFTITNRIVKSPIGRILKGIREDEIFVLSIGKNVSSYKIKIFMVSSGIASIAGALFATYTNYIDPTAFSVMESIFIISIVIIGGAGNLWGSMIGAIVTILLPEVLRFIGFPNSIAANLRQIIYGGLVVLFMLLRPQGFIGEYSFNRNKNKHGQFT